MTFETFQKAIRARNPRLDKPAEDTLSIKVGDFWRVLEQAWQQGALHEHELQQASRIPLFGDV